MADTKKLTKGKGAPPARGATNTAVITADPRVKEGKSKPLQVMIPPHMLDDFNREAGEVFGVVKGAKSNLFMLMWERYNSMKP